MQEPRARRAAIVLIAAALLVYLVMPDRPVEFAGTPATVPLGHTAQAHLGPDDSGQDGLTSDEVTLLGRGATLKPCPPAPDSTPVTDFQPSVTGLHANTAYPVGFAMTLSPGDHQPSLSLLQILRC